MEYKSNFKQRNKVIQGLRSFKDTLPTKIKNIITKKGHIYSKTLDNWKYLVGDDLFKVCFPKSFKKSSHFSGSCLTILVERGHEVDLEYSKKNIINKINTFFGYTVIEKIKFVTFEKKEGKFKKKKTIDLKKKHYIKEISYIKNEKIRKSMYELAKLLKKK